MRRHVDNWRGAGARIALVPTMGALHDGHLTLIREAAARADRVVVSIFVNPTQFAPHEDFARYPRDLARDAELLNRMGLADLVYAPGVAEVYPSGFATSVRVEGPATGLEADFRPHFFRGVATVVTKLFLQCRPDVAVFGEKDYQQLLVVRRLARDLDLQIDVAGVATLREPDGLALSSRNAYLTTEQRAIAPALAQTLAATVARARGGCAIAECEAEGSAALLVAGFDSVDYVAIRDAETLAPVRDLAGPRRILAAARLGKTRLIDNISV